MCTYLLQMSFLLCFFLTCTVTLVCFLIWQLTMKALGCELRKAEMKRIISEVDENGSGKINFESFLRVMTQKMVCEPSWSQRLKFLLPNFTMQVLAVDWVTGSLQDRNRTFIWGILDICPWVSCLHHSCLFHEDLGWLVQVVLHFSRQFLPIIECTECSAWDLSLETEGLGNLQEGVPLSALRLYQK